MLIERVYYKATVANIKKNQLRPECYSIEHWQKKNTHIKYYHVISKFPVYPVFTICYDKIRILPLKECVCSNLHSRIFLLISFVLNKIHTSNTCHGQNSANVFSLGRSFQDFSKDILGKPYWYSSLRSIVLTEATKICLSAQLFHPTQIFLFEDLSFDFHLVFWIPTLKFLWFLITWLVLFL